MLVNSEKIKLHICYVLHGFPKLSETFISDEIYSLVNRGINVTIICLGEGDSSSLHARARAVLSTCLVIRPQIYGRLTVLWNFALFVWIKPLLALSGLRCALRSGGWWYHLQSLVVARQFANSDIDHIHAHFAEAQVLYASALADWLALPFSFTMHGYDIREELIPNRQLQAIAARASHVITVSESSREILIKNRSLKAEKIEVIPCGVLLSEFPERALAWAEGSIQLITVARLHTIKAHEYLIQAIRLLIEEGYDVHATFVGDGPQREKLEALCDTECLGDRINFVGNRTQDEVVRYLKSSHIHVLTSLHEGGAPVANLEAMAMGLPVVATRVGGIPEAVLDGITGLLVPPRDARALADAIAKLIRHPKICIQMGKMGRQRVEQLFSRDYSTDRLLSLWNYYSV